MLFLDQQIIKLHEMCFDWLLGFWKVSVMRCWCLYKGCLTDKSPFSVSCVAVELQIWPELDQRSGLDPSWFPQGRACSPGSRTGACWWSQYWWGHRKISADDDGEEIYGKVVHLFSKLSVYTSFQLHHQQQMEQQMSGKVETTEQIQPGVNMDAMEVLQVKRSKTMQRVQKKSTSTTTASFKSVEKKSSTSSSFALQSTTNKSMSSKGAAIEDE